MKKLLLLVPALHVDAQVADGSGIVLAEVAGVYAQLLERISQVEQVAEVVDGSGIGLAEIAEVYAQTLERISQSPGKQHLQLCLAPIEQGAQKRNMKPGGATNMGLLLREIWKSKEQQIWALLFGNPPPPN